MQSFEIPASRRAHHCLFAASVGELDGVECRVAETGSVGSTVVSLWLRSGVAAAAAGKPNIETRALTKRRTGYGAQGRRTANGTASWTNVSQWFCHRNDLNYRFLQNTNQDIRLSSSVCAALAMGAPPNCKALLYGARTRTPSWVC